MHGYGDTTIKKENMTKLVYAWKLGGNEFLEFLNARICVDWALFFKKNHLLVCCICNIYDVRTNLESKTQIYC